MGNALRNTQCWRNCNQGCEFCCGTSCETCCCSDQECCTCCSTKDCNCFGGGGIEWNPCLLVEQSNQQLSAILEEFEFKSFYEDKWFQEVSLLEHKQQKELIVLKIKEQTSSTAYRQFLDQCNKRLNLEHENIVQLRMVINKDVDTLCSVLHKSYLFFDYIAYDLESMLNIRQEKSITFKEDEIFTIMFGVVQGLKYLKSLGIYHNTLKSSRIYMSQNQVVKICDPALFDFQDFYTLIYYDREGDTSGIYLSPNQLTALSKGEEHVLHNPEKTDIFMLGMIMLSIASLSSVDMCYDYIHGTLFLDKIQQKLEVVKAQYHDSLFYLIKDMLSEKEVNRPDIEQINDRLQKNPRTKMKPQQQKFQSQIGQQSQFGQQSKMVSNNTPLNQSMAQDNNNIKSVYMNDQTIKPLPIDSQKVNESVINNNITPNNELQFPQGVQSQFQQQQPAFDGYQLDNQINEILNRPQQDYNFGSNLGMGMGSNYDFGGLGLGGGGLSGLGGIGGYSSGLGGLGLGSSSNLGNLGGYSSGFGGTSTNYGLGNLGGGGGSSLFYGGVGKNNNSGLYSGTGSTIKDKKSKKKNYNNNNFVIFEDEEEDNQNNQSVNNGVVTEKYRNGSQFRGQKLNGQRHGFGKYTYNNGGMYEGEWKYNKMDGKGSVFFPDGTIAYEGTFKNEFMDGNGILYNEFPDKTLGQLNAQGLGQEIQRNKWTKYDGKFSQGKKKGFGTMYFANGDKYTGGFLEDMPHGQGSLFGADGRLIQKGTWQQGNLKR